MNHSDNNNTYVNKHELMLELMHIKGHPINTFARENEALTALLEDAEKLIEIGRTNEIRLDKIREVAIHYAKKGDLIYPHLEVQYGISGPSAVMWTEDDEIRDELAELAKSHKCDEEWTLRVIDVIRHVGKVIYKENNILFPNCAVNFSDDDWKRIYRDSKDYAVCLGVEPYVWEDAESCENVAAAVVDGEIVMPGGHMNVEQLTALLNTIPLEITFIDDNNVNCFFNEGPKVFKRPGMAIGREVFSCHPPKIQAMVEHIIDDFRNNRRDSVQVWMDKGGRTMLVTYMAVRDYSKKYLGTVELVQDMENIKAHFEKN